jgi:hypothetical protein
MRNNIVVFSALWLGNPQGRRKLNPQPIGYDRTNISAARMPGAFCQTPCKSESVRWKSIQSYQPRKEANHGK